MDSLSGVPPHLLNRYQYDPSFRYIVSSIAHCLRSEGCLGAADVREASVVAEELVRTEKIRERMGKITGFEFRPGELGD